MLHGVWKETIGTSLFFNLILSTSLLLKVCSNKYYVQLVNVILSKQIKINIVGVPAQ